MGLTRCARGFAPNSRRAAVCPYPASRSLHSHVAARHRHFFASLKNGGEGGIGGLRPVLRTRAVRAPSSFGCRLTPSNFVLIPPLRRFAPRFASRNPPFLAEQEMAERVGFEPTVPFDTPHFECGAIDHSATSPCAGRQNVKANSQNGSRKNGRPKRPIWALPPSTGGVALFYASPRVGTANPKRRSMTRKPHRRDRYRVHGRVSAGGFD
jgi:hypothetical protein